jgi:hypothetical protein
MPSSGFAITISATDGASKVIEGVNRHMAAMRAPAERLQKSISKFADLSGLRGISSGFNSIASASLGAMRNVARVIEPLAAITGAASLAGMVKLVESWAQFGSQLGFAAQRIGITAGSLQTLQGAAVLAGSSAEGMTSGLQSLGQTLYDAVGGRAPQAIALMNQLGIAFDDGTRHARKVTDVLPELADKIAAIKDPFAQAQVANAFGLGDLLPILRKGSAGLAEYQAKARRFGVMNQGGIDAANRMRESFSGVQLAVMGLTNSVSEKLAPVIGPLLDQMANWIAVNRDWIATEIGEKVKEFAEWVRTIRLGKIIGDIRGFAERAEDAAESLGGWKPILEGIVAINLVGWITPALGPMSKLMQLLLLLPGAKLALAGLAAETASREASFAFDKGRGQTDDQAAADYVAGASGVNLEDKPGGGPADGGLGGRFYRWVTGTQTSVSQGDTSAAMRAFQSMGYGSAQSAGLAANLYSESKLNPTAVGDGGNAYGIGQWHADRQAYFKSLFGHDIHKSTLAEQMRFVDAELHSTEKGAMNKLDAARTPYEAGAAVSRFYERPGAVDEAARNRGNMATQIAGNALPQVMVPTGHPGGAVDARINVKVSGDGTAKVSASAKPTGKVNAPPPKVETSPIFT